MEVRKMEREETVMEDCKHPDCSYRRKLGNDYTEYCDYIGSTGHSRGCKISECDKYTSGNVTFPEMFLIR